MKKTANHRHRVLEKTGVDYTQHSVWWQLNCNHLIAAAAANALIILQAKSKPKKAADP